jgi:hypothetical protein
VAAAAASLALYGDFHHPMLARSGWWRCDDRFLPPLLPVAAQ